MKWKIAEAKKYFSEVVRNARDEPQMIYNREKIVGVIINPSDYEKFQEFREKASRDSLASAFSVLRDICEEENYRIEPSERKNRTVDW